MGKQPNLTRRNLCLAMGAGLASAFVASCKTRRIKGAPENLLDPQGQKKPGSSATDLFSYNRLDDINQLDDYKTAGRKDLATQVIFYGTAARARMVINLPDYHVGSLDKISLFRLNGDSIAERKILSSNIRSNDTLRPIVFENLVLRDQNPLVIIYTMEGDGSEAYKAVTGNISFHNKYKNLPVYESQASFANFRAFANFGLSDPNNASCQTNTERGSTYQCDTKATVVAAAGLAGYEVCNMMSQPIVQADSDTRVTGNDFNSIIDYPNFICYKLENGAYYRTFVRLF